MSAQFITGYKCNLYFYIFEGLATIAMGLAFQRLPLGVIIGFAAFLILSVFGLCRYVKSPKLNCVTYGKLQSLAFMILDVFLSITFDSAQVFIYALCFGSIVNFVFINNKLSRYQMIMSLIIVVAAAGFISVFTGSQQTMLEFSFGTVVLLVINWVVVSMTTHINFQNRKSAEQERSLDDLLRVVEVKCDQAQEATRSKSKFLANMSHEIRTPINAIMGMNEMILRESREPEIRGYAAETRTAADSLLGIINDILDITKIEAGKVSLIPAEYNMAFLVNDIYNLIKFRAEAKNLKLDIIADENLPSVLIGDDIRLKQIVINLLSNAVKYTHKGTVTLEIRLVDKNKIHFSVRDTGIGIKEENIGKLFAAFERLEEKKNRSIEGTGLGLNITANLLSMFGSELKVQSIYGVGSDFSFMIEQEIVDPTPVGVINITEREYDFKPYNAEFTAPNANILIVDDNEINRKVFVNLLKATKIHIDEAESGMECLELVSKTAYDIIFMDHMMPEMDGIETLEAMRAQENNLCRNTPVIALTANAVVGAEEFYLNAGFDGFLPKPVDPKKLENTIMTTLDGKYTERRDEISEEQKLPIIPGIDWNYAGINFADNDSLLNAVGMFRSAIKRDADELNSYYSDIENGETLRSYRIKVHSMKSSAALVGIFQLSGMAMELETAAKTDRIDIIRTLHPVFIERWLSFWWVLEKFAESDTTKKDAAECREEINGIFTQIRDAAKAMDVDVLDEMSKKLDEYRFEGVQAEKIDEIKTLIFNFEVEKLREYDFDSIIQ